MAFNNDMTMMYAFHDALRRELNRIARVTARTDDDPKHVLRTAAGWEMFKSYCTFTTPPRTSCSGRHYARSFPKIRTRQRCSTRWRPSTPRSTPSWPRSMPHWPTAIAAPGVWVYWPNSCYRPPWAPRARGERRPALIDATISAEQWQAFGAEGAKLISSDVSRFMPWIFEGAAPEVTASVLGLLPQPIQQAYRDQWQPGYANLNLWGQRDRNRCRP